MRWHPWKPRRRSYQWEPPEREPLKLLYDMDWEPPPPVPELKFPPLGAEPDHLEGVRVRLTSVEEMALKDGSTGARLKLTEVEDEYQYVLEFLHPRRPIPLMNEVIEAFCPALGNIPTARSSQIYMEDLQSWVGREVVCDLIYEPFGDGGAWRIKRWRSTP